MKSCWKGQQDLSSTAIGASSSRESDEKGGGGASPYFEEVGDAGLV